MLGCWGEAESPGGAVASVGSEVAPIASVIAIEEVEVAPRVVRPPRSPVEVATWPVCWLSAGPTF